MFRFVVSKCACLGGAPLLDIHYKLTKFVAVSRGKINELSYWRDLTAETALAFFIKYK